MNRSPRLALRGSECSHRSQLLLVIGDGLTESSHVPAKRSIPTHIRAAIATFLKQGQIEAKPFAGTEALGAIRIIYPGLDISDADLEHAISSETARAGFDVDCTVSKQRAGKDLNADKTASPTHEKRTPRSNGERIRTRDEKSWKASVQEGMLE